MRVADLFFAAGASYPNSIDGSLLEIYLFQLTQCNIVIRYIHHLVVDGHNSIEITEPIARLFQDKNFAFVSTLIKDGCPQITPAWVQILKNNKYSILVNTAELRIKCKNLSRNPILAIHILNGSNPYEMVTIHGKVMQQVT